MFPFIWNEMEFRPCPRAAIFALWPFMQVQRIDFDTAQEINDGGDMMPPAVITFNLGVKYLQKRGLL